MGLFTVGVNVMVGQTYHVTSGKAMVSFLTCNVFVIALHWLVDSCEELKLIKEVGEVLRKLWYYFHK